MVPKAVFLLLVLVSQAFATSVLQLRSLEVLAARQSGCPICTAVADAISACAGSSSCVCSSTINSGIQSCITCGVTASSSKDILCAAQDVITTYTQLCPSSPAIKWPSGVSPPTGCPQTSSSETGSFAGLIAGFGA